MYYIGIDCGRHTGLALYDGAKKKLVECHTVALHQALMYVINASYEFGDALTVVFEDARQRKWLPRERTASEYRGRLQGAGSVKRDAAIWEEMLRDYDIRFDAVPPRPGLTKLTEAAFRGITGYTARTSNHARDAAMLVYGK